MLPQAPVCQITCSYSVMEGKALSPQALHYRIRYESSQKRSHPDPHFLRATNLTTNQAGPMLEDGCQLPTPSTDQGSHGKELITLKVS